MEKSRRQSHEAMVRCCVGTLKAPNSLGLPTLIHYIQEKSPLTGWQLAHIDNILCLLLDLFHWCIERRARQGHET